MADQSPSIFVTNIGVINNAQLPLFKVPAGFGGITIIGAQATFLTAGTAALYLIDAGAAGTSTSGGTLASYGGTAYAAKTPSAFSVSSGTSAYIAEGSYLAVKEANVGSTVTVTEVAITYRFGK